MSMPDDDPVAELDAALNRYVLAERSSLGRLVGTGPDLLDLLHRLSTGDVRDLQEGAGRPTVLTTPKGRIVERLFVHSLGARGVLLVTGGAGAAQRVVSHLARFTFAEKTGLSDVTAETRLFAVSGPRAPQALEQAGLPVPGPYATHAPAHGPTSLGHDGLSTEGYALFVDVDDADALWSRLQEAVVAAGGRTVGDLAWEARRVLRGLPAPGHELTDEFNPLEAGLADAVSFDKGCYVGQEVVARLNTYDKISRVIVGVTFPGAADPPEQGTALFHDGRDVGRLTSTVQPPGWSHAVGLAYIKRARVGVGQDVALGSADGALRARLVELPFADLPR